MGTHLARVAFRSACLLGISVVAALQASAAFAQADDGQLETVVVTAQRQTQPLQKVPIAMTVFSAVEAQNLNMRTINDIQLATPGLIFDTGATFPQTYIRGIGAATPTPGLEAPVAFYVDGAYVPRGVGTLFDLVDIDSVQVLKGPQGTLYGRNATGGAILMTTADPTDLLGGSASLEYGRYNHTLAEATINLPVDDQLSIRLAGAYTYDDGFVRNLYNGHELRGDNGYLLRAKIKWQPSSDFTAVLGAEYQHIDIRSPAAGREAAQAPLCVACVLGAPGAPGFYEANEDIEFKSPRDAWYVNLNLAYQTGAIALKSITNYRYIYTSSLEVVDQSILDLEGVQPVFGGSTFEQSFQAISSYDGWFNFLAGVQYINDDAFSRMTIFGNALGIPPNIPVEQQIHSDGHLQTDSFAVYGELYIKPIDRLTLTLGGRYSIDDRSTITTESPVAQAFFNPTGSPTFAQRVSYDKFTPRLVAAYDLDEVNLYASYTKGFKAGGFNSPAFSPQEAPILPENIESYEIGAKFVSSDHRTTINADAYLYNYSNVQVSVIDVARGGQVIENAASARGRGLELDFTHLATDWLTLSGGAAYLDAAYTHFPNANVYLPAAVGFASGTEDLSDTPLARAPKWTLNASADLNVPLFDTSWKARLTPNIRYTSGYYFYPGAGGPAGNDRQPALTLVNLSGGVGPSSGEYEIGFYIDNLLDRRYYETITTTAFGYETYVAKPITYGMRLKYNF